jgi:transcriptional regulator with XRE-family HTH domain
MTDRSARALGRKVAFHRSRRGLSQRDFGAMVDRSETWVSQVERGIRRIDRMTVLRKVAEALEVPLAELAADTPIVAAASSRPPPASALRMLLSSSLTLSLPLLDRSQRETWVGCANRWTWHGSSPTRPGTTS